MYAYIRIYMYFNHASCPLGLVSTEVLEATGELVTSYIFFIYTYINIKRCTGIDI